jgi:Ca2+-binding EF-hand superfamily protein
MKFDINADGKLSKEEIKQGYLTNFNRRLSEEELRRIF